jgi:hypothetical protein
MKSDQQPKGERKMNDQVKTDLEVLSQVLLDSEKAMEAYKASYEAYVTAKSSHETAEKKLIEVLVAEKLTTVHVLVGDLSLTSTPGKPAQARPGHEQIVKHLTSLNTQNAQVAIAEVNAAVAALKAAVIAKNQANPKVDYAVTLVRPAVAVQAQEAQAGAGQTFQAQTTPLQVVEEAPEVPKIAPVAGIAYYTPEDLGATKGHLIRFCYSEVVGKHAPDPHVKGREDRDQHQKQGWVQDVFKTQAGYWCVDLRNQNLRTEDGKGEFPHRRYRLEGILPGTLEHYDPKEQTWVHPKTCRK